MRQLSELTEFKPKTVYTFQHEEVLLRTPDQTSFASFGQLNDMLEGYLHAQDVIIPYLRLQGLEKLTPELITQFIKDIHKRLGHSLLEHIPKVQSGEFTNSLVMHWHHGDKMPIELGMYLLKLIPECSTETQMLAYCKKTYPQLNTQDVNAFLKILNNMMTDRNKPIHSSYLRNIGNDITAYVTKAFARLATAWHDNTLDPQQRQLVAKFVRFTPNPDRLEPLMTQWAENMLAKWKTIDTKNIDAFSLFLAEHYYQMIMDIHPFPNANKRTAKCWMNIMLRFSGYPDIILKRQAEDDTTSKSPDVLIQALAKDIRDGLDEAKKPSADNETSKKLFEVKLSNLDLVKQILAKDSSFSITEAQSILFAANPLLNSMPDHVEGFQLIANQLFLAQLTTTLASVTQVKEASPPTSSGLIKGFFGEKTKLTLKDKLHLEAISGLNGWSITSDALTYWRTFNKKEEAESLLTLIQKQPFCNASVHKRMDTNQFIIKLDSIDLTKMFKITSLNSGSGITNVTNP